MKLTTIEYKGVSYPARETAMGIIAHIDLQYELLDEAYESVSEEARQMDESIHSYADSSDILSLSDDKLLSLFE